MITLGSTVRDSITGFAGIATSRTRYLHGCLQIGITPSELHDGKIVEGWSFDEQRIEILGPPADESVSGEYPLGSKVADPITGLGGIATGHTRFLFSTEAVAITPCKLFEGKPAEPQWFDVARVKIVEERAPFVSPESRADTGGPAGAPPRIHR